MGRILLLAALVYGYGDAGFDGHRPESFDRPLRDFHLTVNTAASEVQRILVTIDNRATVIGTLRRGFSVRRCQRCYHGRGREGVQDAFV